MIKYLEKLSIPQIIVLTYIFFIALGTLLLALPISSAGGEWTPFIDALFTSTSAVSVTGVTIYNTLTYWNYFGKTVLMILLEVGGLGFMTIWVVLYYNIVGSPNLKQRQVVSQSLNLAPTTTIQQHVWNIIQIALIIQVIGAVLLSFPFIEELGIFEGIYYAVFHSVSAFTNGGLDLFSNSLVSFQDHPYILIVFMLLITAGGLGFIVWDDLIHFYKTRKLKVYTKVVLITTTALWILGMVVYWIAERENGTFDHLSISNQFLNYLFLSVTVRSSGLTNVNFASLSVGSIALSNILIFIGATSGSTGGGIKVSTLAVILIVIVRLFQGKRPVIFNRNISTATVRSAFFIFTTAIFFVAIGTVVLAISETLPPGFGVTHVFTEVVSALGVVGVSIGLTPYLSTFGKLFIILLMLIGRVGVMTFLWSVAGEKRESRLNYPDISFILG